MSLLRNTLLTLPLSLICAAAAPTTGPDAQQSPQGQQPPRTWFDTTRSHYQAGGPSDANSSLSDYPAAEVQAVPSARARYALARAEADRARQDLHATVTRLYAMLERGPEFNDALARERVAYAEFDAARRRAVDQLSSNENYQALHSIKSSLGHRLERAHEVSEPDLDRIIALAGTKLTYGMQITAMESDVLVADNAVRDARARLVEASGRVTQLRQQYRDSVRYAPDFLAAQQRVDDTRIAEIASEEFFDGAVQARNIALRYNYDVSHLRYRTTQYPYGDDYNRYGYGYR